MFEWHTVPSFGGGLNLAAHPAFIRDDQWSAGSGWLAKYGCAEVLPTYLSVAQLPVDEVPTGVFQNPYDLTAGCVVATMNSATARVGLFTVSANGAVQSITDGGDAAAVSVTTIGNRQFPANAAMLNGYLCLSYGFDPHAAGQTSLIRWAGGTTFQRILPAGFAGFAPGFLRGFGGHLVAGFVGTAAGGETAAVAARSLYISDANNELDWLPSNANSADSATLDDTLFGINGLEVITNNLLAACTRNGLNVLQPTGGIPPFTRAYAGGQGVYDDTQFASYAPATIRTGNYGFYGVTPYGTAFRGFDDLYLGDPIGAPIFQYYRQGTNAPDGNPMAGFVWHGPRGLLGVPMMHPAAFAASTHAVLWYDTIGRAWSEQPMPAGPAWCAHGMVTDQNATNLRPTLRHWIASQTGTIMVEGADAAGGESVDTKDFAFDGPANRDYVDRIKIDWEPLAASNDALEVLTNARNNFAEAWLGQAGFDTPDAAFTPAGTLVGGQSELPLRVQGKFVRFRFRQQSGRPRIRGFAIRRERASDRKTP